MIDRVRGRIYELFNTRWGGGRVGVAIDLVLVVLIGTNIIAFVLETESALAAEYGVAFRWFEVFSVSVFTLEYVLRLWSCTAGSGYAHPVAGRIRWACSPMAIIDLLAILPFYLPMLGVDLRALRVVRLARILRLAKLGRYTRSVALLASVLRERKSELLAVLFMATVIVLLSSIAMYYAERERQPESFGSVPRSMLWTVTNLTPLSATGARPETPAGIGLSVVIAIAGVGVIAMPTGIVGAGFVQHARGRRTVQRCPQCGADR
ncbi:MAG: ion transporter [Planctomycetota bacterium]